jgi:hypothetical protein
MSMQYFTAIGYEETPSAVTATPSVELGARRFWKGEEYVYCYNAGGAAINTTVALGVKLVTGASGYSIAATSLTDVVNPCVGVVKHAAIAAGSYGWAMVKGFATVSVVTALTADYEALALGAAGVFVGVSVTTVGGTAAACGYALNANTGAAGSVYAFIKTSF